MTLFDAEVQRYVESGVGREAAIRHVQKTRPELVATHGEHEARRADVAEKAEQAYVVKLLRAFGFRVWTTSQARASRVSEGLPDVYAIHTKRPLATWVECKRQSGGRIRPAQQEFADLCHAASVPHLIGDRYVVEAWLVSVGLAERARGALEPVR